MKIIGRGTFSKVYLKTEKRVQIHSEDPIKECMSLGWFPKSLLFPRVSRVDYKIYEMDYFPKVKSLKGSLRPSEWNKYRTLRKMSNENFPMNNVDKCQKAFEKIEVTSLREALLGALRACSNYGYNIGFEISPRNVTAHRGRLILLDCFFCADTLSRIQKQKFITKKRYAPYEY